MFEHFRGDWAIASEEPIFFRDIPKKFFLQSFFFKIFESFSKIVVCVCWAYAETISSHAEHTQNRFIAWKCLKVEYLGRIEYDFQKSRVTGPWDHKVSVSAKKSQKKVSCLCTFKRGEYSREFLTLRNGSKRSGRKWFLINSSVKNCPQKFTKLTGLFTLKPYEGNS